MKDALTIAAEGGKADITKPLKGFGSCVHSMLVDHYKLCWARAESLNC